MAPRRPPQPPSSRTVNPFAGVLHPSTNTSIVSDDEISVESGSRRQRAPRPSMIPQRRRRRSSCTRLSIAARNTNSNNANLSELYQKAIRLNAENKINVGNSWNLQLIENMDKVVAMDSTTTEDENNSRVNFTKASCTLDASVKIYGYRVDDVHLTSYKVLANLNRTDHKKSRSNASNEDADNENGEEGEFDDDQQPATKSKRTKNLTGNTLETNLANINLNKLDSAFDIDPLFHKMTKTFDEGGAKGLLLVNLGVGSRGCNIVFDSSECQIPTEPPTPMNETNTMDISGLVQKFKSILESEDMELFEMPLVPQLAALRAEHNGLEQQGYCDTSDLLPTVGPKTPGKRLYHSSETDEAMADRNIHQLAAKGRTAFAVTDEDDTVLASPVAGVSPTEENDNFVDFGGFHDDGVDDEDDTGFDTFIANINPRFSDVVKPDENPATQLLNALESGRANLSMDDYSFLSQDNQWAGAMHWKQRKTKQTSKKKPKKTATKRKTKVKPESFVTFSGPPPDMSKFLKKPKASTQLSKAAVKKLTDQDNLLPIDTKVAIQDLANLFLRPDLSLSQPSAKKETNEKTVAFDIPLDFAAGDDNHSYGDDDNDGPGFEFAGGEVDGDDDDEDLCFHELEGVRKVEKVQVGYATVAKKVDVKRLKKDLWTELEGRLVASDSDNETETTDRTVDSMAAVSFQDMVKEMEQQKTQADVSLPFYFISMLHLANEHGLRLNGEGLEDFTITKD